MEIDLFSMLPVLTFAKQIYMKNREFGFATVTPTFFSKTVTPTLTSVAG
jgi:hypothetical protein